MQLINLMLLLFFILAPTTISQTLLQVTQNDGLNEPPKPPNMMYCESWRLAVETNNAGEWHKIPHRCTDLVKDYVNGQQYITDSKVVARHAQAYAKTIVVAKDGKDVWIFDVDETLISNIQHYAIDGYRSKVDNESAFEKWALSAKAPALPWSLWLYKKLQGLGFHLVLLTGRKETHRNSTEQNLISAGYHSWKKLILRNSTETGKTAQEYKASKRAELVGKGYRIHGNSGDQWSDLLGWPEAKRSFKIPNPMYHIP
ncbi:Acid phosphatase protein [Dioscorea alata]|uniref:Acid phosphatase protein n=1 Tax=Dioscorea alata TaxID=55571 RepID=A0ACB7TRW5_DIOAL|nr:Acid phosphatase protein [Dioscorea alata]